MDAPLHGDTWLALTREPLRVGVVADWVVLPRCGGLVVFSGTVRDHAEHRTGVTRIVYEAYAEQVQSRLTAIADEARRRWPELGRLAILHREGPVDLEESSVVVAASAPHRPEAFEAARFCIDTLKASVPIWKRESWEGGEDWGLASQAIEDVSGSEGAAPERRDVRPSERAATPMSGLGFLMIAFVLSVAGSLVLLLRQRKPTSMDHAVDEFQREMRALAPHRRTYGPEE